MPDPVQSFQHYEVLRQPDGTPWELGRGAMGVTYKAFDVNLCCEVALKVVSSALVENSEARERFVREARAAAALRHRNVASVFHLGNDGEHFFYAMEFIKGETLDALVRRDGPLSVTNTLRVVLQVARALAAAERQGLVHRDIKPANLMVTHEDADEETVVKVIDFGLARQAATVENAAPLTIGGFVGTPQYASPEQLEERPLDARSDLYSLGITAWFLLTGRVPFTGSLATICQLQLTQPPPWEQLSPDVPTCVRGLLGHLLAKAPARRPQNAAELRAEIEACLDKVQGTTRRQDLHLPAGPQTTGARRAAAPKAAARVPQTGTLLHSRYRLLREIGGRHGVRVYQARDESEHERPVAVKILPIMAATGSPGWNQLSEEVRLVRAAAHPNLVQVLALEQSASPAATFLVEEWLTGFTLRDLLAGRDGALPVAEALPMVAQAALASDHAALCRLELLDFASADLHLHFPALATTAGEDARIRALLSKRLTDWPEWTLKVPAFRLNHDASSLHTWAGGVTLVPGANSETIPSTDAAGRTLHALATLTYELLGGVPTRLQPGKYVSLAVLNEEGNAVLRQALMGGGEIVHGWQLHEALASAVGAGPVRGNTGLRKPSPENVPARIASAELPSQDLSPFDGRESTLSADAESVAALSHGQIVSPPSGFDAESAGSAWERLTLVTAKRTHPGRWVAGVVGLAAVFILGFVGVLAWLLHQTPAHAAVVTTGPERKRPAPAAASPRPRTLIRQPTPAPLPVHPVIATPTAVTAEHRENVVHPAESTPVLSPAAVASVENSPPSPAPTDTPATPARERYTMVRLESVPTGARICLGSETLGTTPCRVRLPAGEHELIARYQNWPVTHYTVRLDGTEVRTSAEIRLMRPDLVPGSAAQPSLTPDPRTRRIFAPAARHALVPEAAALPRPAPTRAATLTPEVSEPEVRPAQRVLTPFRIDGPAEEPTPAQVSPGIGRQPFSADAPDEN